MDQGGQYLIHHSQVAFILVELPAHIDQIASRRSQTLGNRSANLKRDVWVFSQEIKGAFDLDNGAVSGSPNLRHVRII